MKTHFFAIAVAIAIAAPGCALQRAILHSAMRDQIAFAEGCPVDRVKVLENEGPIARVSVCGRVKVCRWSEDARSWVCKP